MTKLLLLCKLGNFFFTQDFVAKLSGTGLKCRNKGEQRLIDQLEIEAV